jgi:hypothetical protein
MEHRCGQRVPVDVRLPVRLKAWPRLGGGHLRDVSVSGAFIETDQKPQLLGLVEVEVRVADAGMRSARALQTHVIPACTVRWDRSGIGVEWLELAPAAITALIAGKAPEMARPACRPPRIGERPGPFQRSASDAFAGPSPSRFSI